MLWKYRHKEHIRHEGHERCCCWTHCFRTGSVDQFNSELNIQSSAQRCPEMTGNGGKSYARGLTGVKNVYLSNAIHESSIKLVRYQNRGFLNFYLREIKKGKTAT